MILLASPICVPALFVIFCSYSQFLWLSLTRDRSYWFHYDSLISLLRISLLKIIDFGDLKLFGLKNVD